MNSVLLWGIVGAVLYYVNRQKPTVLPTTVNSIVNQVVNTVNDNVVHPVINFLLPNPSTVIDPNPIIMPQIGPVNVVTNPVIPYNPVRYGTTIFIEDYEVMPGNMINGSQTQREMFAKGWSGSCPVNVGLPCYMDIVTDIVHSGNSALRLSYPYDSAMGTGSLFDNEYWAADLRQQLRVPEFFERWYCRWDIQTHGNFASILGKIHYYNEGPGDLQGQPNFYLLGRGYPAYDCNNCLVIVNQTQQNHMCPGSEGGDGITCNLITDIAKQHTINFGQWYCIETHFSQSIAELWLDGVQLSSFSVMAPYIYNTVNVFRQSGYNTFRYEDDYVVATERIGA